MPRGLTIVLACLAWPALHPSPARAVDPATVIRHVTVIDVKAGKALPDQSVVFEGDTIKAAGPAASITAPPDARVIDATGQFLIPGLCDAHVHYSDPESFGKLFLANGITFIRDTGASTDQIIALRDQLNRGELVGPQMICTGAIVDGNPPVWPFSEACDTPDEARAAVRKLKAAGVDQIKVYSRLKLDVYQAAIDEAHKAGLKATGHIPFSATIDDAIAAGQDCDEHLMGFEKLITKLAPAELTPEQQRAGVFAAMYAWDRLPSVDKTALRAEIKKIADAGMVQCPTIVVMAGVGSVDLPDTEKNPLLEYMAPSIRSFWKNGRYSGGFSQVAHLMVPQMQTMVAELHRAGVPLLIGTDLSNPYVYPGFSVHEEMKLWKEAGIPNADILRSATITPAKFFGLDARLGSLEPGKTASAVLLSANPLDDITNTTKITTVFERGRCYDRAALDQLLAGAKADTTAATPTVGPDDALLKLDLPGEVIARGHYKVTFGEFDAGTEDFLITKTADGFLVKALNQPKGGMQKPFLAGLTLGPDHAFKAGTYKEMTKSPTEATYSFEGNTLKAAATRDGKDLPDQTVTVSDDGAIGAPMYISDFMTLGRCNLKPGEEKSYTSFSFGYPDWRWVASPMTLKREPDATLKLKSGKEVTARYYTSVIKTPIGELKGQTWTDDRMVPLKSITVLPFGTVTVELQ